MDIQGQTTTCVRCFKPAKIFTGHVIKLNVYVVDGIMPKGKVAVIAGWCSKRCLNDEGFSGLWNSKMGWKSRKP